MRWLFSMDDVDASNVISCQEIQINTPTRLIWMWEPRRMHICALVNNTFLQNGRFHRECLLRTCTKNVENMPMPMRNGCMHLVLLWTTDNGHRQIDRMQCVIWYLTACGLVPCTHTHTVPVPCELRLHNYSHELKFHSIWCKLNIDMIRISP